MKRTLVLIILLLLAGCSSKKIIEPKENTTMTLYICEEEYYTYYYYFNDGIDIYSKAEAKYNLQYGELTDATNKKEYLDNLFLSEEYKSSSLDLSTNIEGTTLYVTITANNNTPYELYKLYFGDRYNLTKEEINKTFNHKCLISRM